MNSRKNGVQSGVAQGFASGHEDYRQHLSNEKEEQWYAAWANECKRIQAG
jgi:hypothetical protein